jgi:hypothetical protein
VVPTHQTKEISSVVTGNRDIFLNLKLNICRIYFDLQGGGEAPKQISMIKKTKTKKDSNVKCTAKP